MLTATTRRRRPLPRRQASELVSAPNGRYIIRGRELVAADEAALSPFDIGLLRGYAVFDLLRTANGRPFLLAEHLERLRRSASRLGLSVPATDAELSASIDRLLERNAHQHEATIRLVLTGGESPDGMSYDPQTPTLLIMTHDLREPPAALYESGATLLPVEHCREVPDAKTTNYLTMLRNKPLLAEHGALDLLYHDEGVISEAASASFYIVRGTTIISPEAEVLWGTIGALVLERARATHEVACEVVTLEDAFAADEAFLTSTTRGVVPIVALGGERVGNGEVGPVTRELMRLFREALAAA